MQITELGESDTNLKDVEVFSSFRAASGMLDEWTVIFFSIKYHLTTKFLNGPKITRKLEVGRLNGNGLGK